MYKRILALMIAALLAVNLPAVAFAEEIEGTTAATESSTETTAATEATQTTETNTEPPTPTDATDPTVQTDPTQSTEATDPTQSTEAATDPTQATDATEPTQGTEATNPTDTTEPTEGTEPTQSANPTDPTEPAGSSIPTSLEIDTENIYEGMDKAYEDGYVPKISNGMMYLVLPLLSNGDIHDNEIKVSLNLGSSSSSPFEIANYEKTFELEKVKPQNSEEKVELFLVEFDVKLSSSRTNGVYPVVVNVSGYDDSGSAINCTYTLYVTITDGKSNEPPKTYVETPTAEPVVFISNSVMVPGEAMAGEEFTLTLTLKNSLTTKSVKNMLVKVDTGNLHINLLEDTNIFQIDKIAAGGETTLTLQFGTDASIPAGKYTLNFTFNYDSSKTLNLSSSGTAIVEIQQPANMELVMPRFPQSVTVGETIPLSLQVMNMGRDKMYNVRCVVSGYGFAPANTGYIGAMEAGSSATTEVELYIIALNASKGNESGSQYGATTGTITLIYEDESGEEFSQEVQFETSVNRPIVEIPQTDTAAEEEEKATNQWWISVVFLGGVICAAGIGFFLIRQYRKNRSGKYL